MTRLSSRHPTAAVERRTSAPRAKASSPPRVRRRDRLVRLPKRSRGRRPLAAPVFISALLHGVVLLALALWVLPTILAGRIGIEAGFSPAADVELAPPAPEIALAAPSDPPQRFDLARFDESFGLRTELVEPLSLHPAGGSGFDASVLIGETGRLGNSDSVEGAVDRITQAVLGELAHGDLLVVWMFDASNSLVDDRRRVAARLETFFDDLSRRSRLLSFGRLTNAVVSFGTKMQEHLEPTDYRRPVVELIADLPIDQSGQENIFTAVEHCVDRYESLLANRALMLVVWTDESGDDADRLEAVISKCRNREVAVHVVGPSAVLGAETGVHVYTDPKTDLNYLVPVTKGPDTAVVERLRLGYWFHTRPPRGMARPDLPYRLPTWYGGNHLSGITSGLGPFALTRLALASDGSFTILDSPRDRPPFSLAAMEPYLPDYRPAGQYRAEIEYSPLRRGILRAVELTRGAVALAPPKMIFFGERSLVPPYKLELEYHSPSQFRTKLRGVRRRLLEQNRRHAELVEEALSAVSLEGDVSRPMEARRAEESSPRWRAWYDLTRGRLLAVSARLEEYRLVCDAFVDGETIEETTNCVMLFASHEKRFGAEFLARGEEASALLRRCVEENPDTPWAYLARRELVYDLGIRIEQKALKPVAFEPPARVPPLPKF